MLGNNNAVCRTFWHGNNVRLPYLSLFRFLHPIITFALLPLPAVTQIQSCIAGPPPPSPLRYAPSFLSREDPSAFSPSSTSVESLHVCAKLRTYVAGHSTPCTLRYAPCSLLSREIIKHFLHSSTRVESLYACIVLNLRTPVDHLSQLPSSIELRTTYKDS